MVSSGLPDFINWADLGAVTPVKNQKHCGSCWAFSSTGALEGQHFIKTKQLVSLSEQNLVDCVLKSAGCSGGSMDTAFEYVTQNKGIDTEQSYAYEQQNGECRFKKQSVGATAKGFKQIPVSDEHLKEAVALVGPISVAIDATGLNLYEGGVYTNENCSSTQLNHAVLVVGYGTTDVPSIHDYWLVKNSWGEGWGESGYIRMSRKQKNICGISSFAMYPLE